MLANKQKVDQTSIKEIWKKKKGEIILDETKCRGCNTCMLACSFHHASVFSKELSSIKVSWDYPTGKVNWTVNDSCDLCEGEKDFLCLKYCPYDALSFKPDPYK